MDPFSIAALIATIAGTGYKMYAASKANSAAQAEAHRNQELADLAAADAMKRGAIADENLALEQGRMQGSARAAYGVAGLDASSGSPLAVLMGNERLMAQDRATLQSNTKREAWALKNQKDQIAAQARLDDQRYRQGQTGSLLGGAMDVAAQSYQYWGKKS